MKDTSHHLKHIQRKVIRSARLTKDVVNNQSNTNVLSNVNENEMVQNEVYEKRSNTNHRVPRILARSTVH